MAFSPSGDYALLLAYPAELYRYDATTQVVDYIGSGTGEYWNEVNFSTAGDYALVAGGDDFCAPSPVLWHYEDGVGLSAVAISGVAGAPLSSTKLTSLQAHPTTGQWVVLGDNAAPWPGNIACLNTFDADFTTGVHLWSYFGCVNIDQGSESVAWASTWPTPMISTATLCGIWTAPATACGRSSSVATATPGSATLLGAPSPISACDAFLTGRSPHLR